MDAINNPSLLGEGITFDYGLTGQHIADNYPANPSTYSKLGNQYSYFRMIHKDVKDGLNLVDSKWHHLTIHYTKPTSDTSYEGHISYSYDDRNRETGLPKNGIAVQNIPLDLRELGLFKNHDPKSNVYDLSKENTKMHWGFTGSTGKFYENNLIVFESIPSFVDVEAKSEVHDDSNDHYITKDYNTVAPNSDLTYSYTLNYKGWTKSWKNIVASMKIPQNITFTSGQIYYPTTKKTYDLTNNIFQNPNEIIYNLPDILDSDNRTAIISLKAKAASVANTDLKVPSVSASFTGDNLITDTTTPEFTIKNRNLLLQSDSSNPIILNQGEDAIIKGNHLTYTDHKIPNNSDMSIYCTLNGKDMDQTIKLNYSNPASNFSITIDKKDLKGINTLSFYAKDYDGNISNVITRQIDVGGTVAFKNIANDVYFKNTLALAGNQIVPRMDTWTIEVIDSRIKGKQWSVQAQQDGPLKNSNTNEPLNGYLFYKDPQSDKQIPLTENPTVATNTKNTDATETENIASSWTSQSGILLSLGKNNRSGTYKCSIYWTLQDSLKNA